MTFDPTLLKLIKADSNKVISSFKTALKMERSNLSILIDSNLDQVWLVTPTGQKTRTICGYDSRIKGLCWLPAGFRTDHFGAGRCFRHSNGIYKNNALSKIHNYPTRLKELLEESQYLENNIVEDLDGEVRTLYALQNYILTSPTLIDDDLSLEQLDLVRNIIKDLVKTKMIAMKLKKEVRLDNTTVIDFVNQIFTIITKSLPHAKAQQVLKDIMNYVVVPFKNRENRAMNNNPSHKFLAKKEIILEEEDNFEREIDEE